MSKSSGNERSAILMVMTEAPAADEREFHDWYDLEHVPERARIGGFQSVQRYVCIEGWPRYMALYDLDHIGVLANPAYVDISGVNFSPWSKRVIAGVRGWLRIEAIQRHPGNAASAAAGYPLRVAVLRFRDVSTGDEAPLLSSLKRFLEETQGVLQFRLFQATPETGDDFYAIIELSVPLPLSALDWPRLVLSSGHLDIANMYTRYWRNNPPLG